MHVHVHIHIHVHVHVHIHIHVHVHAYTQIPKKSAVYVHNYQFIIMYNYCTSICIHVYCKIVTIAIATRDAPMHGRLPTSRYSLRCTHIKNNSTEKILITDIKLQSQAGGIGTCLVGQLTCRY